MVQTIQIRTQDGVREYKLLPSAAALQAAADAGEITVGEEVVYRTFIVLVLEDFELLILGNIPAPVMDMGPEFVPPVGGMGNVHWFTVDPSQFRNGGPVGNE